jgi:hypothetical protein
MPAPAPRDDEITCSRLSPTRRANQLFWPGLEAWATGARSAWMLLTALSATTSSPTAIPPTPPPWPAGRPRPDRPHRRPPGCRRRPGAVARAAHPGHRWPHSAGCRPSGAAHRPGPRVGTGRAAGGQDPHPRHHHRGQPPARPLHPRPTSPWPRTWPGGPPPPSSTPTEPTIPTHPHQPLAAARVRRTMSRRLPWRSIWLKKAPPASATTSATAQAPARPPPLGRPKMMSPSGGLVLRR